MSHFFISDTHFGHTKAIEHSKRPFTSVEEMNGVMIRKWNEVVKEGDTVWHLGDLFYKCRQSIQPIVDQLNGNINIILGNHDEDHHPDYSEELDLDQFRIVTHYITITLEDQMLVLFHYPIDSWHDKFPNREGKVAWHLHGHTHGRTKKMKGRLDVGVDTHDFRPWSWEQIKQNFGKVSAF